MATSGTTTFNLDFDAVFAVASAQTGGEDVTGFDYKQQVRLANLTLMDMSTMGVNMWAMDRQFISVTPNIGRYWLPADTIDVLEMSSRTYSNSAGPRSVVTQVNPYSTIIALPTVTVTMPNHGATVGDLVAVDASATVGGVLVAAGSYPVVTVTGPDVFTISPGTGNATSTVNNAGGSVQFTFQTGADVPVARMARDIYQAFSNKFSAGRPTQAFIDRQTPQPIMNLFPIPAAGDCDQIIYYRKKRIQDITDAMETIDVPPYFLAAFTAGITFNYAKTRPGLDMQRLMFLKSEFMETIARAKNEDRDPSSLTMAPDLSGYFIR